MNKSNEEKDRILAMLGQITTSEQHFNSLESEYRKLASTWLLAALGACGYILTQQTKGTLFDPWLLVSVVCLLASTGIFVLLYSRLERISSVARRIFCCRIEAPS